MFFLLSKLSLLIFSLPAWLLAFLIAALVARPTGSWRRRWLWSAVLLLFISGNTAIVNGALLAWEKPPVPLASVAPADAAVLLTGISDNTKSPHDRVYLSRGADRFTNALWLYRAHKVRRIIISGGSGSLIPKGGTTEATELATLLRLAGVPQRDLLLETRSRNTRENARFTQALLAQHPDIKSLVLVTSAFHQRRALGCFNKVGLNPTPFPADFRSTDPRWSPDYWLVPDAETMGRCSLLLHELAGYLMYRVAGYC
ncbi:MAG: hypothetical protein JWR44_2026 [Hymenobacter sp.]|nr:hypothetical protein [Hymenobacter sp.]